MVIALAAVSDAGIVMQAFVLALVGIAITVAVYGVVALIVKADDLGAALATRDGGSMTDALGRAIGRALVLGMPGFLMLLGALGTAAMIWVGGGIIVHGFEVFGVHSVGHAIDVAAEAISRALPIASGAVRWIVVTLLSGLVGLLIGTILIPLVGFIIALSARLRVFHTSAKGRDRHLRASKRD
jgi:predicted DNA repair protein MutK